MFVPGEREHEGLGAEFRPQLGEVVGRRVRRLLRVKALVDCRVDAQSEPARCHRSELPEPALVVKVAGESLNASAIKAGCRWPKLNRYAGQWPTGKRGWTANAPRTRSTGRSGRCARGPLGPRS